MSAQPRSQRRLRRRVLHVHKPEGVLHKRVQTVGPQRFGIVSVDCAKARSKWMLCDFYGAMLLPPALVTHSKGDFDAATGRLREAMAEHRLKDMVVAVERTGDYHLPVKRAFQSGGFEVRVVHPFATKQFRQPADPGNKTDDTDLAAIHRATVNGFGLLSPTLSYHDRELQLLARHRRDLVEKSASVCCQIREHLHAAMPGFAELFDDLWESRAALTVMRHTGSAQAVQQLGEEGLTRLLRGGDIRFFHRTVVKMLTWTASAPGADSDSDIRRRIYVALDDDRQAKQRQIQALERDIASLLVRTPYVLLLSIPGIHVVSAADFAAECGPIRHYANANHITGRAGLFPSRYQSDQVDHADGPLVRCANRRLRATILTIADNLIKCNDYFSAKADLWKAMGKDPRKTHVKIAKRFTRIAYQMVAGQQVFRHPCRQQRTYILDKLLAFHRVHATATDQMLADLQAAVDHIPRREHHAEAQPLTKMLDKTRTARTRGPQLIGEIIPLVLAKLGLERVQLESSGGQDPS